MKKKRSRYKIETPTTKALKRIRNASGLSIVKAAREAGIKPNVINHVENGRTHSISEGFIEGYVESLGFTWQDWEDFLEGRTSTYDLRQECKGWIEELNNEKLKAIHSILLSFAN